MVLLLPLRVLQMLLMCPDQLFPPVLTPAVPEFLAGWRLDLNNSTQCILVLLRVVCCWSCSTKHEHTQQKQPAEVQQVCGLPVP
jgi:hypothetical protein